MKPIQGQIHCGDSICKAGNYKPILELYVTQEGVIEFTVEQGPNGPSNDPKTLGKIPLGTTFTYELRFENGVLQAGINGDLKTLNHYKWDNPLSYFQAGNYNQASNGATSEVHFKALNIEH